MTHGVRLVNIDGAWTSESERSQMEVDTAQEVSDGTAKNAEQDNRLSTLEATKIGPPWTQDPTSHDLYPNTDPGDAGIGTLEKPVAHVAIGTQEATGVSGMEGVIIDNADLQGGGVMFVGLRDVDPANPPDPIVENAPILLFGNPVLLGNQVMIELSAAITKDHEVILGPSTTLSGGRHFAPLLLGPEKVYQYSQDASDSADHDILDQGEIEIVSMTLTDDYDGAVSTFSYSVQIDNPGNKETTFNIITKVDGAEVWRRSQNLNANSVNVSDAAGIGTSLVIGQVVSLDVQAVSSHVNSQGWVRGTVSPTRIAIQQG